MDEINEKKGENLEGNIENAEVQEKADVEIEVRVEGVVKQERESDVMEEEIEVVSDRHMKMLEEVWESDGVPVPQVDDNHSDRAF